MVDHFTRHAREEEGAGDGSLLLMGNRGPWRTTWPTWRCWTCLCGARFLRSAVAASAIALARMAMGGSTPSWSEEKVKATSRAI